MIDSSMAATRQLHTALRIVDEDDLSAHMLAYNAYCLLRDKFGLGDAFVAIEEKLGLREIPEFLKHADWYPHAVLKEHSAEAAHITFTLAILLWKDNVGAETEPMRTFGLRKNPYEPAKLHHAATEVITGAGRSATSPRSRLARPTRASNADRDASNRDFLQRPGVRGDLISPCSATHT